MNPDENPMDLRVVKELVQEIVTTRPNEIDCPECFESLDRYADLILYGEDASAIMPTLHHHLEQCIHCSQEFEALVTALRALG
jgi:hypothetical protein